MPELPEVETIRRYLKGYAEGKTLLGLSVYRSKNFEGDIADYEVLKNQAIKEIARRGKFLIFRFNNGHDLISHLRMEGKWFVVPKDEPQGKHDIARFILDGDSDLVYNDTRKFGFLALRKDEGIYDVPPLSLLGKEPWDLSSKELLKGLKAKPKRQIKEALLDQTLICGLGNIYADETLFATHINPRKPSGELNLKNAEDVIRESKRILELAIDNGGSTVHTYAFARGKTGHMQTYLKAYGREGYPCPECGAPLRKIAIGGRGTTYCPFCQKDRDRPLVYAVSGPIASGKSTVSKYLKDKGYAVYSADEIVASLYENPANSESLEKILGKSCFSGGKVDKKKAAALIAEDPEKKKELEDYIHPLVYKTIIEKLAKEKAEKVLLDIPLFAHSPYEEMTDFLIVISAPEEIRAERIKERGRNPEDYLSMNKGYPLGYLKKKAALLLDGSGSIEDLQKQLEACPYL